MKYGVVIYDKFGAQRNKWFIEKLISSAKDYDLILRLIIFDNIKNFRINEKIDFAIVRTISPKLVKYLNKRGIKTFNNVHTSLISNDKWKTYKLLKKLNLPTMDTEKISLKRPFPKKLAFPLILKSTDGHGGSEVFFVKNKEEIINAIVKAGIDKNYILQQPCDTLGKDCRAYILNDKVLAMILRTSSSDFRSNYSLGGDISIYDDITNQKIILDAVNKIQKKLKTDFIGIDFIFNNDTVVVNEIEDVVGCRMLYSLTKIEAHTEFLKHIKNSL